MEGAAADGTASEDPDEGPPPDLPPAERWARSIDLAGAALLVVGCLGVATWAWTVVRSQYVLGGVPLYSFGRDLGIDERMDVFATQVPNLLLAGVVAGMGIALRSFATTTSDALRSAGGPVFRRPFGYVLGGAVAVLAVLLLTAIAFGEEDEDRDDVGFGPSLDEDELDDLLDEDGLGAGRPGMTFDLDETTTTGPPEPTHTLEVHTDGCGVIRSGEVGDDLTWVVKDLDGFQVLGRVASGETRYRYFRPGTYTVILEGPSRSVVSNEVTIVC